MGFGRPLILLGGFILVLGFLVTIAEKTSFPIGRLPGDLQFHGRNWGVYFPLATSFLLSLLASALMWFLRKR